jgi:hypothetical protein
VGGGILRFATPTFAYKVLNHLLLGIIIIQICVNLSFAGSAFGTYEVQRPICKVCYTCHLFHSMCLLLLVIYLFIIFCFVDRIWVYMHVVIQPIVNGVIVQRVQVLVVMGLICYMNVKRSCIISW